MAFRSAIEGLDKVIRSDILPPKVILVTGPPGSMKTSFCYTLMSRYLKDTGEFGLYTTLEETVQSHLRNMESTSNIRKLMFYFFKMLRDNELTSLVVMERAPNGESQLLGNEGFLVDGIVILGLDRSRGKLVRYLQVEKMRSVDHSMEKHAIEVRKGGLTVLGPIFETGGNS